MVANQLAQVEPPYDLITTDAASTQGMGLIRVDGEILIWLRDNQGLTAEVRTPGPDDQRRLEDRLTDLAGSIGIPESELWTTTLESPPPTPDDLPVEFSTVVHQLFSSADGTGRRIAFTGTRAREFSAFVQEKLRYYVYMLLDPRDGAIFYVGKGVGNRVFQHARAAGDLHQTDDRLERIREILHSGNEPNAVMLRFGLDEQTAFHVESAAIQLLGLKNLHNRVHGHHITNGLMGVDVAISIFEAPPAPLIDEPTILLRITRLWDPAMTPAQLYETARGWWRVGSQRNRAKYAMAISNGIVREVYAIQGWRQRGRQDRDWEDDVGRKPRWGFDGVPAPEMGRYRNTDVSRYFQAGAQGPIKYLNC